ncbi:MAG: hypothetical protein LBT52_03615, partial [Clostridiales Family XIII bacterium]|nr:hypothetical protein [Clostridiales Family XIII bacterium]
ATKQPATASAERALTASIKQRLAESVMDYMVPQKFLYVDSLPLTPNGKLDRKRATAEVNRAAILKEHPAAAHKARPATSRKARREVKRP